MAEAIGALAIRIGADASELIEGFSKGTKATNDLMSALKALGITVSAGALAVLAKQTLDATAALNDLAVASGASVEGLSALQRVAKVGGHDFEGLTGQIGKMVRGLKDGTDESNSARLAFKAIGVQTRDNNGRWLDTSTIIVDLAKKIRGYADDGGKMTLVQDALGKSAERYLPLLKDIADGTDLHATVTKKQAEAAEQAEKNIRRLNAAMEDNRRELVNEYTPAFNKFLEVLLTIQKQDVGTIRKGQLLASIGIGDDTLGRLQQVEKDLVDLRRLQEAVGGDHMTGRLNKIFAPEDISIVRTQIQFAEQERAALQALLNRRVAGNAAGLSEDASGNVGPSPASPSMNYRGADELKKDRERALEVQGAMFRARKEMDERELFWIEEKNKKLQELLQYQIDLTADVNAKIAQQMMHPTMEDDAANPDRDARLVALRDSLKSAETLENDAHTARMSQLAGFSADEVAALGGFNAAKLQLETRHADSLRSIRSRSITTIEEFQKASWLRQAQHQTGMIADMTAGLAAGSRTWFMINKIAGVSNIAVKTPEAIANAYAWGTAWGGPPGGAAMAALAGAAMLGQAAAIASAQFGGGGGSSAPSIAGSTAAQPVSPVGGGEPGGRGGQTVIVRMEGGDMYGGDQIRGLVKRINEATEGGGRVVLA